jgi:hypothetical protein
MKQQKETTTCCGAKALIIRSEVKKSFETTKRNYNTSAQNGTIAPTATATPMPRNNKKKLQR